MTGTPALPALLEALLPPVGVARAPAAAVRCPPAAVFPPLLPPLAELFEPDELDEPARLELTNAPLFPPFVLEPGLGGAMPEQATAAPNARVREAIWVSGFMPNRSVAAPRELRANQRAPQISENPATFSRYLAPGRPVAKGA